jgi:hypothetical protein
MQASFPLRPSIWRPAARMAPIWPWASFQRVLPASDSPWPGTSAAGEEVSARSAFNGA